MRFPRRPPRLRPIETIAAGSAYNSGWRYWVAMFGSSLLLCFFFGLLALVCELARTILLALAER